MPPNCADPQPRHSQAVIRLQNGLLAEASCINVEHQVTILHGQQISTTRSYYRSRGSVRVKSKRSLSNPPPGRPRRRMSNVPNRRNQSVERHNYSHYVDQICWVNDVEDDDLEILETVGVVSELLHGTRELQVSNSILKPLNLECSSRELDILFYYFYFEVMAARDHGVLVPNTLSYKYLHKCLQRDFGGRSLSINRIVTPGFSLDQSFKAPVDLLNLIIPICTLKRPNLLLPEELQILFHDSYLDTMVIRGHGVLVARTAFCNFFTGPKKRRSGARPTTSAWTLFSRILTGGLRMCRKAMYWMLWFELTAVIMTSSHVLPPLIPEVGNLGWRIARLARQGYVNGYHTLKWCEMEIRNVVDYIVEVSFAMAMELLEFLMKQLESPSPQNARFTQAVDKITSLIFGLRTPFSQPSPSSSSTFSPANHQPIPVHLPHGWSLSSSSSLLPSHLSSPPAQDYDDFDTEDDYFASPLSPPPLTTSALDTTEYEFDEMIGDEDDFPVHIAEYHFDKDLLSLSSTSSAIPSSPKSSPLLSDADLSDSIVTKIVRSVPSSSGVFGEVYEWAKDKYQGIWRIVFG
ncbi:hypothetical protein HDU67_000522 [Dinochytrium kinnereticum]|nr:hypothetical protein HDU67_000522 [Dinochytrium kinnereticum]